MEKKEGFVEGLKLQLGGLTAEEGFLAAAP